MKRPVFNITLEGKKQLEEELKTLIAERPAITERIAIARSFGDLSENEEYSSARNEQKIAETRILQIEEILKNAKIIKSDAGSKISLGSTVTFTINGKEQTYTIVGPVEADPAKGKISDASPIGKALLGKNINQEFALPNGNIGAIISIN